MNTTELSAVKTNFYTFPPGEPYGFQQQEIPWIELSWNNLISRRGRKGVEAWIALKCRGFRREMSSYSNLAERIGPRGIVIAQCNNLYQKICMDHV